jgi:DNA-binding MarR family transcriptional regulator
MVKPTTQAKVVRAARPRKTTPAKTANGAFSDQGASEPVVISRAETVDANTHNDTRLGFLMHDITRMRRSALDQMMKKIGVTRAQWWVIAHLSRHDGMMQVELAAILDIGKASLGNLVERLDAAGWIERRFDPIDKRAKRVFLTGKARELIEQLHSVEYDFNELALKGLSRQSRDDMLHFLTIMKSNLVDMAT